MINPFKTKKGLGRGLSSLIGDSKINTDINKLFVSDLVRNKLQPRKVFDKSNLEDLTNSIKERGIIQPIIVRSSKDENNKSIYDKPLYSDYQISGSLYFGKNTEDGDNSDNGHYTIFTKKCELIDDRGQSIK